MNWKELDNSAQLEQIIEESYKQPVAIYKHSTRCSVSFMAKRTIEHSWTLEQTDIWLLDLIKYRSISNNIASTFAVRHESPQLLLIKEGKVVYHASHSAISVHNMAEHLS